MDFDKLTEFFNTYKLYILVVLVIVFIVYLKHYHKKEEKAVEDDEMEKDVEELNEFFSDSDVADDDGDDSITDD